MQKTVYVKTDLLYNDYDWNNSADHVKFKGDPDRNVFMPNEGNDVLYIINCMCTLRQYSSKLHAGRMEILIHEKLPIEVKSQNSVFQWLQQNYVA